MAVATETLSYACQNHAANELVVNFFETDPPTILLERGDRTKTLWRVGAADAGLYEGQNVGLLRQGNDVNVTWLDPRTGKTDELQCKAR